MAQEISVHLYDVHRHSSPVLEEAITNIGKYSLEDRLKAIGGNTIRLESFTPPFHGENQTGYWLLDFVKIRTTNGPGKASRTKPIAGFDLDKDDGFGEETAVLYDPSKRVMLFQYNHNGPRATIICNYFNTFDPATIHDYEFWVRLQQSAQNKLNGKSILTKIHAKISPQRISEELKRTGVSLSKAIEMAGDIDGAEIEIIVTAGRKKKSALNFQKTRNLIDTLQRALKQGDAVDTLKVYGKKDIDSPVEPIDLIEAKLETTITGLEIGSDLRLTRHSRWEALIRARNGWSNIL